MFYICRFSDTWSLYDTKTKQSRLLQAEETVLLKKLFGALLSDSTKILCAIKVESIHPNKLLQLPMGNTPAS